MHNIFIFWNIKQVDLALIKQLLPVVSIIVTDSFFLLTCTENKSVFPFIASSGPLCINLNLLSSSP